MADAKNKGGRPTSYSIELADIICERLASGESMRSISRDDGMPASSSMFKWIRENKEFSEQYAIAKQESADAWVEEILDIADDGSNDWMEVYSKGKSEEESIGWKVNGECIQRSRLRVDTRKWAASKMNPKKYGDKIQQDVSLDANIESTAVQITAEMSHDEATALYRDLMND